MNAKVILIVVGVVSSTIVLGCGGCMMLVMVAGVASHDDGARKTVARPTFIDQSGQGTDTEQQERMKIYSQLKTAGIFYKLVTDAPGAPRLYVMPKYFQLPADQRRDFAAVMFAYVYKLPAGGTARERATIRIYDAVQDREWGSYSQDLGLQRSTITFSGI